MLIRQALRSVLLASPSALLFGTFVHELAHGVVALLSGGGITEFRPYPIVIDGHFVFGYVAGENGSAPAWLSLLAPQIADTALALGGLLSMKASNARAKSRPLVLLYLFVTPLVDVSMALSGLVCASTHSDWFRVLEGYEVAATLVTVTYVYLLAACAWPVVRRALDGIRVYQYVFLILTMMIVPWGRRLIP